MRHVEAVRDEKLVPNISALPGYRTELGLSDTSVKLGQDGSFTS
jgi:hypothetical protein